MPPKAAALAKRRPRLADLPARPILGLLVLTPTRGDRCHVALRPAGPGLVIVEAGGGAIFAALEVEGELTRPLALPRAALATLRRRNPTAERLAIDGPASDGPGLLRLSALDQCSAATVLTAEATLTNGLGDLLTDPPPGDARGAVLDPVLIAMAVAAMREVCPGPAMVSLSSDELLGFLIRGRPVDGDGVVDATVAVARMLAVKGARS